MPGSGECSNSASVSVVVIPLSQGAVNMQYDNNLQ